ncbi:hypothetical protein [Novosphingobium sp.]|uniref:hypothetical protein n=1 Tax=Novosphingobium sp. TaxID=1874826 RepID=UPI0035AF5078
MFAAIAAAALLLGGCSGRDQELAENAARAEAAAKRAEDAAARAEAAAKKAGAEPAPAVVEAEPEVLDTEPDNPVPEQPADDPAPTTQG